MKKERRWMKSVIAAAAEAQAALPWERSARRRPLALALKAPRVRSASQRAIAAR